MSNMQKQGINNNNNKIDFASNEFLFNTMQMDLFTSALTNF